MSEAQSSHQPDGGAAAWSVRLDADDIEAIAERVAEKLRGDGLAAYGDVQAVCARFGVSPDYV